jgi:hypothetical protein
LPSGKKQPGENFEEAKRRVTDKLMPLDYVSGVGSSGSRLRVMLARPLSAQEDDHVRSVLQREAGGHDFTLEQTGTFSKR